MAWAPDYCTDEELEDYVRVSDEVDTVQMALACTAASRAIDRACNRQFGKVASPEARYYTARWDRRRVRWVVDIDDLMTASGIAVSVDLAGDASYSTALTAYDLKPLNAVAAGRPWTELVVRSSSAVTPCLAEDGVKITASWGWSAVPDTIKQACLMQANRLMMRRESPYGVAGNPDLGTQVRLLAKVDPDVDMLLRAYRRPWSAVGGRSTITPSTFPALFGWH